MLYTKFGSFVDLVSRVDLRISGGAGAGVACFRGLLGDLLLLVGVAAGGVGCTGCGGGRVVTGTGGTGTCSGTGVVLAFATGYLGFKSWMFRLILLPFS